MRPVSDVFNIIDLHSHTNYSNCGKDAPAELIKAMILNGVEIIGITDHNYGIGNRLKEYANELRALSLKYSSQIRVLCGIEICTKPKYLLPASYDLREFDYCLIENLSDFDSVMQGDLFGYAKKFCCPVGIAHTDLFLFMKSMDKDPKEYLRALAEQGFFWELNVNYDSIHKYREHEYVKIFMTNEEQQRLVKDAGLHISIGFDGHRMSEYKVERVEQANRFLKEKGLKNAIDLINLNPKA